jgi:hypothetical protein
LIVVAVLYTHFIHPDQLEELHQPIMDVLKAVQVYINKMITEVSGMKVLLLDAHTVCHITR